MTEPNRSRPQMKDYGIHQDPAGMLPWDWVIEQMTQARNYWVCSTRPDSTPHAAPVWGVWVDGTLYFSTSPGSRKGRNLDANPAVVVHLESGDESVIAEGTVERVTERDLLGRIVDVYAAKYDFRPDPDDPSVLWLALRPKTVFAWREADFPRTATRWTF